RGCDTRSLYALATEYDSDRLKNDNQVQEKRVVVHVCEIVFQLDRRIRMIITAYLRQARNAELHLVPFIVAVHLHVKLRVEFRSIRSWPDQAHVAFQDV